MLTASVGSRWVHPETNEEKQRKSGNGLGDAPHLLSFCCLLLSFFGGGLLGPSLVSLFFTFPFLYQAAQNPEMLTEAMSMLRDPETIKAAEEMMQDPEFKSEISQYIETIKNNSAFQAAMGEARRKYQARGDTFL